MRNQLLYFGTFLSLTSAMAQTATNFNSVDCNSVNHDLFAELDAGKVVVITWVMPCGTCIGPASMASAVVASYANPNVVFYLCDDYCDNACSTVSTWATNNSITYNAVFCDENIDMLDYGSNGMPKTVVLGGTGHNVFFNKNGAVSQTFLEDAIDYALLNPAGIDQVLFPMPALSVFPNPTSNLLTIDYTLGKPSAVSIEVVTVLGEIVMTVVLGEQVAGSYTYNLFLESLEAGLYFVNLKSDDHVANTAVNVID